MKFLYKIKAGDEKAHSMEAMSYKKMLKSLVIKFPNQIVNCFYKNKKGNYIDKIIDTSKIKQKD